MINKENKNGFQNSDGVLGFIGSNSNEIMEMYFKKKEVIPVPKRERNHIIYRLLEDNCGVIFCTEEKSDDFMFECYEHFAIFAIDRDSNCFGTIGGIGDVVDDDYPVGYVCNEGQCGKIADNIKEFLELVNFYPFWYDILKFEKMKIKYSIADLEAERIQDDSQYLEKQNEIAKILNLSKNNQSIELLISNLKDEPRFIVYGLDEEQNDYEHLI